MLSRVETSFYKPLGASLRHLLRQLVRDLCKALLQPACTFYNSVDDRVTYASAPKWDGCEHVCRLPDECDRNAVDVSIHTHQLSKLEKLVSSDRRHCHTKAASF